MSHTIGQLQADDLGLTITVRDGGATYTGSLNSVSHETNLSGQPKTMIVLRGEGSWRHIKTYSSDTVCDIAPATTEAPA